MPHDAKKYLDDMLDRATFVRDFMSSKSMDDLLNDRVVRSALERELMVLGEALFQLHRDFPEVAESIAFWREIIGFQHTLVHGYDSLNMHVIWDVIHKDLDPLIQQIQSLLDA